MCAVAEERIPQRTNYTSCCSLSHECTADVYDGVPTLSRKRRLYLTIKVSDHDRGVCKKRMADYNTLKSTARCPDVATVCSKNSIEITIIRDVKERCFRLPVRWGISNRTSVMNVGECVCCATCEGHVDGYAE